MNVQSCNQAQELLHEFAEKFDPGYPTHLARNLKSSLFSGWQRSWVKKLMLYRLSGNDRRVDRLSYTAQKIEQLVERFPELCASARIRDDLYTISRSFHAGAEACGSSSLLAKTQSLEESILRNIEAHAPGDSSVFSNWLDWNEGQVSLLRHALIQQNPLLALQASRQILVQHLFGMEGGVLYIDPSVASELDDDCLSYLLSKVEVPDDGNVVVFLAGCTRLGPSAIDALLQWNPTIALADAQCLPDLYDYELQTRDGQVFTHAALIARCPDLEHLLERDPARLELIKRSTWKVVDCYLRRGEVPKQTPKSDIFRQICSLSVRELSCEYGRVLSSYFLEHCWRDHIDKKLLLEGIELTRLANEHELDDVLNSMAAYLSHCLGLFFDFGTLPTPSVLETKDLELLHALLQELPGLYTSTFADEIPFDGSLFGYLHQSRIQERLYLIYWIVRNAPKLFQFYLDPLQSKSSMQAQGKLLKKHFSRIDSWIPTHGYDVPRDQTGRTVIVGTDFIQFEELYEDSETEA